MAPRPASARLTAKGQTTLPKQVRHRLALTGGGFVAVHVQQDGVTLQSLPPEAVHDAMLAPFLALMHADIVQHPAATQPGLLASDPIWQNLKSAYGDFDRPIAGPVAL